MTWKNPKQFIAKEPEKHKLKAAELKKNGSRKVHQ